MKVKKSIIKQLQLIGPLLFLLFAMCLILNNIYFSYQEYKLESQHIRTVFIENQKASIKNKVNRVVNRIKFQKNHIENLARKDIRERVYGAYSIVENIYNKNKDNKTKKEIQEQIIDALRNFRFNNGNGYFFINDLDGNVILSPIIPSYEKQNIISLQDSKGKYVVKEQIKIINEKGEGFTVGYCPKPNSEKKEQDFKKISFVKLFKPLNWSIGTGLYLEDLANILKIEILNGLNNSFNNYTKNGYLFIVSYDGTTLLNSSQPHLIGKNIWNLTDPNGVKVIQEERKAVENPEGDFIYYSWNKPSTKQVSPKVSFMKGIDDWKWMIGSGVYLDTVEDDILELESQLKGKIKKRVLGSFIITSFILFLFLYLINRYKIIVKKDYNLFVSFFDRVARSNEPIERDNIKFSELDKLAKNANDMLLDKMATEQENIKLSTAVQQSSSVIVITDLKGNIEYANPKFTEVTGYKFEEVKNKNPRILKSDNMTDGIFKVLWETISSGNSWQGEFHNKKKNGELFWERVSISPIFDSKNKIVNYLKIAEDVTEKKKIESELLKMDKLRSIGTLAGGIAHDFNNVLTGVYGNISLAKIVVDKNHEVYSYLVESEKSMNRAVRLTKQLLTFSKGGAPIKEDISLNLLLNEVIKFDLSGSNVKAVLNLEKDLWDVNVDKGQISQVFSNLTMNANQATPDGGNLYVYSENAKVKDKEITGLQEGNYVKIIIKDEGMGIDEKYLDKIFDPYFTTKQTGNGLGLATSYSIINNHDGQLMVESELGKGTIFTVYLRAVISRSSENKRSKEEAKRREDARFKFDDLSILIMDDEEMILQLVSRMIERVGCTATTSLNGDEAIELYKKSMEENETPFDLVILDLTIPGGTGGKETIKQILDINPEAKVIVSSGYSSGKEAADYLEHGFKGILEKPYTIKNLVSVMREVI